MQEFFIHPFAPVRDLVIVEYPRVEVIDGAVGGGKYHAKHSSLQFRDYVMCNADSRGDLEKAVEKARGVVKGDVCSRAYLRSFAEELMKIGEDSGVKNVKFVGTKYHPPRINGKKRHFHEPHSIYFNSNEVYRL